MTKVLSSHGSHIPTRGWQGGPKFLELQGSLSVVHAKGFSRGPRHKVLLAVECWLVRGMRTKYAAWTSQPSSSAPSRTRSLP